MPDVIRVFVNTPQIIKVLTGPPGPAGPEGPPGSGGGGGEGLKQYANVAELNAVKSAEIGVLTVEDTLAAFPELDGYVGNGQSKLVVTTTISDHPFDVEDSPAVAGYRFMTQTAFFPHPTSGNSYRVIYRKAYYDAEIDELISPYDAWTITMGVRPNTAESKGVAYAHPASDGSSIFYHPIPASGTYTLKAVDGSLSWVEDVA